MIETSPCSTGATLPLSVSALSWAEPDSGAFAGLVTRWSHQLDGEPCTICKLICHKTNSREKIMISPLSLELPAEMSR